MNSHRSDPDVSIEDVLQLLDPEIWIVTAADQSRRGGLVATWVSQASLDPERPAMVIGLAPNHFTAELVDKVPRFALHLISEAQIDIAWNFALGSGRDRDKLAGVDWHASATGSPVLNECLAWLDCRVYARLATGDRTYYWADVVAGQRQGSAAPLTQQRLLACASNQQRQQLMDDRRSDIALHRPLQRTWRANMPAWLSPA